MIIIISIYFTEVLRRTLRKVVMRTLPVVRKRLKLFGRSRQAGPRVPGSAPPFQKNEVEEGRHHVRQPDIYATI